MNGILLINKEENMTSFDVVAIAKRALNTKKIGHCGTLDPNATGLLVLLVNNATKILPFLEKDFKVYHGKLELGRISDTKDIWGHEFEYQDINQVSEEQIKEVFQSFMGQSEQIPPKYSAIKINGKKLYEYARKDIDIEIPKRSIFIHQLDLISFDGKTIEFICKCSSGTYIRSLCEDIALRLNNYGLMSFLNRLEVGQFNLNDSYTIDQLRNKEINLLPIEKGLYHYPYVEYDNIIDVHNGKKVILPNNSEDLVFITHNHLIVAAYEHIGNHQYKSVRGLW
ncbi:MAG: tRNA pseudouridine(55) synthase TruB [Erysipelotrichaceae bacterium]